MIDCGKLKRPLVRCLSLRSYTVVLGLALVYRSRSGAFALLVFIVMLRHSQEPFPCRKWYP